MNVTKWLFLSLCVGNSASSHAVSSVSSDALLDEDTGFYKKASWEKKKTKTNLSRCFYMMVCYRKPSSDHITVKKPIGCCVYVVLEF